MIMLITVSIKPLHKGKLLCPLPMTKCTAACSLPFSCPNSSLRWEPTVQSICGKWWDFEALTSPWWSYLLCRPAQSLVSYSLWPPWTLALQTLSVGFSRQEYCSGLSFPPPGDLPNPGIKPESPASQTDSLPLHQTLSFSQGYFWNSFCFLC